MEAINLRRIEWENLGGFLAIVVLLGEIAAVWRSLDPLFTVWQQPEYSHAWLILPLALLIFIYRFGKARLEGSKLPGMLIAILSVILMLLAWATGSYTGLIYGALLGVFGFAWASLGTQAMRNLAAPLIYLFFMVPLPVAFYISTSAEMQLFSSKLGMALISLGHIPATLEGNIIILPSAKLEVAEACSGLRYLFPLISFAFLISMLMEDRLWKKILIVFLSIPIAIILNACRIAMIAILLERFQIDTTSGSAHALEGFAVFFVCIVLLFVVVSLLLRIGKPHGRLVAADILRFDRDSLHRLISWPLQRVSLLTGMVLVAGTSLIAILPARTEVIPQREPLALFPMEFAGWHGVPKTLDNESLDALSLTDYLLADYSGEASANVPLDFYVAYYASQRAGIHAHSPQLCIPAGGWSILRQSVVDVPLANGQSLSANRVVIEKHGARQIVYYWFEERGHHIATESSLKYYALRDALIDNRTDGALVRVVVPIHADEASADVMAKKLITDAMPRLRSFIPGQASR